MQVGSVFTVNPPADADAAGDQIRPELVTSHWRTTCTRSAVSALQEFISLYSVRRGETPENLEHTTGCVC